MNSDVYPANEIEKASDAVFPDDVILPLPPIPEGSVQVLAPAVTESFTDSQGRTLMYRYSIPDGLDSQVPQEVMLYFHGNNSMTQQEILDAFFPAIENDAVQRGVIPVVVASPETRSPPQEEVRQWYAEDKLLIREFLLSGFEGHFQADFNHIYFLGGSQGSCFIHDFMMEYGDNYGGGFYGGCGCYNSPDPLWNPSVDFKNRFKVFINSSTEDFLYETSQRGYAYYKYTLGMNTQGRLEHSGGHCSAVWSDQDVALDWFTGINDLPEEPFRPHWKRVSVLDNIQGVAISKGVISLAQQSSPTIVSIWNSADGGQSWSLGGEHEGIAYDLDVLGGRLFLALGGRLYWSEDLGKSFQQLPLLPDRSYPGYAYYSDQNSQQLFSSHPYNVSSDYGSTWQELRWNNERVVLLKFDPRLAVASAKDSSFYAGGISFDHGMNWKSVNDLPSGRLTNIAWDDTDLWGNTQNDTAIYKSNDLGQSWVEVSAPESMNFYGEIYVLNSGEILFLGGWSSSWLSSDHGETWRRVPGSGTYGYGIRPNGRSRGAIYEDPINNRSYISDGDAIFYLVKNKSMLLPNIIFKDSFELSQ